MRILIIIIFSSLLISCSLRNPNKINQFESLTLDTILIKHLYTKTTALNLSRINLGVDSFELRIWHGLAMATPKCLTILKYSDSSWHLTRTDYWMSFQNNYPKEDIIILDSLFTKKIIPTISFSNVLDSIEAFRLDTFPSQEEIPGFQDNVADGMGFTIELATSKYYKVVNYNNPKFYKDPYNQKMNKFLLFLNKIGVNTTY